MAELGNCGLCGVHGRLVKSHIVPRAIITAKLEPGQFLTVVGTKSHPKRSRTGVYSRIVCDTCEKSFHADDEYLLETYRSVDAWTPVLERHGSLAESVDPLRLTRAILSVLFRAHLSSDAGYARVDLGPLAEPLRRALLVPNGHVPGAFGVLLRHLTGKLADITMSPQRERWDGINAYRFYLPRMTAIVRVDRRKFTDPFAEFELREGRPVIAMHFDRFTPSEMRALRKIVSEKGEAISRTIAASVPRG